MSGTLAIVVPVLVLQRLQEGPAAVGVLFAVMGGAGVVAATLLGRIGSHGQERALLALPALGISGALGLLTLARSVAVAVGMALIGAMTSLMMVALFSLRQRRTDPAWWGRAFAISTALNWVGSPIGSALAGPVVARSLTAALLLGTVAGVLACVLAWLTIPAHEPPA